MSQEDGCLVVVKLLGGNQDIVGSVDRTQSVNIAKGVIEWLPEVIQAEREKPKLTVVN
jgi:hypothetical protein